VGVISSLFFLVDCCRRSVLFVEMDMRLLLVQLPNTSAAACSCSLCSCGLVAVFLRSGWTVTSSAKAMVGDFFSNSTSPSFMNTLKRKGARTVPWGTPAVAG